jgi:glucokinase
MEEKVYLGLDIGASNINIGLGDEENLYSDRTRTVATQDYWSEEGIFDLILETLEMYDLTPARIEGIGIGVPGLVDVEEKRMEYSHALEELDFDKVSELDVDIEVENDANAAVMGEVAYGDGADLDNVVTVIIGSGIGGGVRYGGEVLGSQADGRSPEPSGIIVDDETTWDESVGGENMPEYLRGLLKHEERETELSKQPEAEELFEMANDEVARDYIDRLAELNARGIATMINLYSPEIITFSGSVAVNNPEFMEKSLEKVEKHAINPEPEMKISELGNDLGLYGALALAQRKDLD